MIINFSISNINFEAKKKKRKKEKTFDKSFPHIYKEKTKIKRKEKEQATKAPIIPQETIIAGYFPNIKTTNEDSSFLIRYKNGVKLSQGKVLLKPKNDKKNITITPDLTNNKHRKKYIVTIEDKITKERKTKVLTETALLQEERFCAGTIERKEKDSFNIFYSTNGYSGCIIRANSDECERLMEREQIEF